MKVDNLILNRLGNSFSVMISYPDKVLQLSDEVYFFLKDTDVRVTGVCSNEDNLKIEIELISENKKEKTEIMLNNFLEIHSKKSTAMFYINDDRFTKEITEPEILFKLGFLKTDYIKIEQNNNSYSLNINHENFLKGITEFIIQVQE
ncbi:hypothetical protein [Persephonella sp.]